MSSLHELEHGNLFWSSAGAGRGADDVKAAGSIFSRPRRELCVEVSSRGSRAKDLSKQSPHGALWPGLHPRTLSLYKFPYSV